MAACAQLHTRACFDLFVQVLTCCGSKDFELTRCVASGQNGIVFAARCLRRGMPRPQKLFALKLVFNFGLSTAATRNTFENEFNVLSRLPPHANITRFWTQFVDEVRCVQVTSGILFLS